MVQQNKTTENTIEDLLANPFGEDELTPTPQPVQSAEAQKRLIDVLPKEHREKAMEIAKQMDHSNRHTIVQYGANAQTKLSTFSNSMLEHVQKKDIGPIGDILIELMTKLEQVNPDELSPEKRNVFSRFFGKVSRSIQEVLSKYQKIGAQVERITVHLEKSKRTLLEDIKMLDQLYEHNKEYFDALNIYIAAGEVKLEELHTKIIPEVRKKAEQTDNQMMIQEANDLMQFADRLEKRLHDLKLSRQITIQSAPQIRMIQNMNQTLAEKIQSSILTSIPLWKNQISIALTLHRQKGALEAQKQVTKTTNELLLKNADMLKSNTLDTARENERGIVDIETLKKTQEQLITTIQETLQIQHEGRMKRKQAEQELITMETELKQRLLELKDE
ncbi:toxic anion resistance protein [Bacillus sp. FJAT-47783]|uniref:toxic anion resistance protein n=1 Tax=Bacillus sp. FJAT-47783 TaxID=2922712 RepID=UPI001FAD447D|nr:toxic anion resistance protein [Bacillus sp. FJAT-47783]